MKVYNFEPDFRRRAPDSGLYCCVCQKPLKDDTKALPVTINWENWQMVEGHGFRELVRGNSVVDAAFSNTFVGRDCWNRMKKLDINH